MNYNTNYISTENIYAENDPRYIVIHNTDNYNPKATALAHAKAQSAGDLSSMSAHWYVDDGDTAYQAADYSRGCWHVGKDYSGGTATLHGVCTNHCSIGVEGCVQGGYDYEKLLANMAALTKHIMQQTGIDADHVVRHYDVCGKHCPSAIMDHGDWERFKSLLADTKSADTSEGTQAADIINTAKEAYNGSSAAQQEIISRLGPAAKLAWTTYGFLPSVLIAQCILESGWLSFADADETDGEGHSGLTPSSNNCLGMNKDLGGWIGDVWGGRYGYYWVPQEHNGQTSYGAEKMREYADLEHCLADFAGFRTSRHPCIAGNTDYNSVIDNGLCGGDGGTAYATSSSYGPRLKTIIETYNLTQYDPKTEGEKFMFEFETVKPGDSGVDVLLVQEILKARINPDTGAPYYDGPLDRVYDKGMGLEAGINAYQDQREAAGSHIGTNGEHDSICGRAMWQELLGKASA